MKLATWSLSNPIPSAMFFFLLSIAGVWGFNQMPLQNLPDIDLPTVTITISQPGATPSQLEAQVARKAENALAAIQYLKHMRTSISDGIVKIDCEFEIQKQLTDALIETKDAIERIRPELPLTIQAPVVKAILASNQPIVTYSILHSDMDEESLSWFVDNTISKLISGVSGVGRFERVGGVNREIKITFDPVVLASLNLSPAEISNSIKRNIQDTNAGRISGQSEQSIRATASLQQANQLRDLPVSLPDGNLVVLGQIADIEDVTADRSQLVLLQGEKVVAFKVYRAKGYDESILADEVEKTLQNFVAAHPAFTIQRVHSNVDYTRQQYEGSMRMIYEGIILSLIVVFIFLRDIRSTLISAVAIPLSILPTFAVMHWFGFSLNSITLLALAMVIGILIDDAIVEIENIDKHITKKHSIKFAVEVAVNDIALAVIATSLALIVVFLPTALMPGISGLFFREFGWTASVAVFASLLVARMIIPLMAATFIKYQPSHAHEKYGKLQIVYSKWLTACLSRKRLLVVAFFTIFLFSLIMVPYIPKGFIPEPDKGYVSINFELQPGSTISDSETIEAAVRKKIMSLGFADTIFSTIGGIQSGTRGAKFAGEVRKGNIIVLLEKNGSTIAQMEAEKLISIALKEIAGARFGLAQTSPGGKLTLILTSESSASIKEAATKIQKELRMVAGLANVSSMGLLDKPEIAIRPNFNLIANVGISTDHIAETIRLLTIGQYEELAPRLYFEDRQVPIQLQFFKSSRGTINDLKNFPIISPHGLVPLGTIAEVEQISGPVSIDRYDRKRYISISADLIDLPLGDALEKALQLPSIISLPSNVNLVTGGDEETMAELGHGFKMALIMGVLGLYCLLAILFKDFIQPIIILCAIPLSLGGALIALVISDSMLCLPSMIGIIMLAGIATKNSILIIEQAEKYCRLGLDPASAAIEACVKRAKPIIMTSCAMIAGMLPICFGFIDDSAFRKPMAFAVIGGLILSTILCLFFVPVLYAYSKKNYSVKTVCIDKEKENEENFKAVTSIKTI
ncbi:MAG: hypothetical protein B0W54_21510 [Cellvibrio sp. 79]|nr:MAG: hypothetical protein B0W54_21510 [Cellvibrio sp. 79]